MKNVRVRFAPSPTGFLHIGGLRTALFNYLFAKKHGGTFILRIEDTDAARYVPESLANIIEALQWYGLIWDEGPDPLDPFEKSIGDAGPYIQSKRKKIYQTHVSELLERSAAYPCFCTTERLDSLRKKQASEKQTPRYDGLCRALNPSEVKSRLVSGTSHTIRLRVPTEGSLTFRDMIRGEVTFECATIDDQVLLKSDGFPTYHLANVVDDHLMNISHVIRAEEWLPSTPKHILLYKALEWTPPFFAHLPMILGSDRTKLSKRHGAEPALEYRQRGFLPQAVINYIALLGWNPGGDREFFTLNQLTNGFSIEKVNKAPSIFDIQKMRWTNASYLRTMEPNRLAPFARKFVTDKEISDEKLANLLVSIRDRIETLEEIGEWGSYFFQKDIAYDPALLIPAPGTKETALVALIFVSEVLEKMNDEDFTEPVLRDLFVNRIKSSGKKNGEILWPLRVAISGKKASPDVFAMMAVLGREVITQRVATALILAQGLKKA
ncbi:MAG: glutamate--tRNA ligase [Candidatus Kerfeldbacteria bacterium RIFCSPLOWO2_01_FULL_48_11]|uniref:Glutamate--tRNA ligase n=1 Tax=Candidatus Kerfeldbacteria bacterium RIFCSPLOWO2_01_FULL_48_11 TaxID=1798543 RepID=A0A1G2B0S9_9BACT|nr:MAG: Glutamate-tRNA ligase [Parcubacteria group bacterium GW2011_GWA2_48_9]OGY82793.1 MAG: glutamate--tRNA ligase [Candidatus Kerfeldbacteria bacterium RIFCSPLOWO2_01_FULL_48_11]HCM68037.1 glutamate--tRNA ligase [Candidatus Kerfeldbacteria bacterium]